MNLLKMFSRPRFRLDETPQLGQALFDLFGIDGAELRGRKRMSVHSLTATRSMYSSLRVLALGRTSSRTEPRSSLRGGGGAGASSWRRRARDEATFDFVAAEDDVRGEFGDVVGGEGEVEFAGDGNEEGGGFRRRSAGERGGCGR